MPYKPAAYDPVYKTWDEVKAAQRADRKRGSAGQDQGSSGPGQMVAMYGRAARRAMLHRRGDRDQVQRSRCQRQTRKRRTGGVK